MMIMDKMRNIPTFHSTDRRLIPDTLVPFFVPVIIENNTLIKRFSKPLQGFYHEYRAIYIWHDDKWPIYDQNFSLHEESTQKEGHKAFFVRKAWVPLWANLRHTEPVKQLAHMSLRFFPGPSFVILLDKGHILHNGEIRDEGVERRNNADAASQLLREFFPPRDEVIFIGEEL